MKAWVLSVAANSIFLKVTVFALFVLDNYLSHTDVGMTVVCRSSFFRVKMTAHKTAGSRHVLLRRTVLEPEYVAEVLVFPVLFHRVLKEPVLLRWIFNNTNDSCFYKDAPEGKSVSRGCVPGKDGVPAGAALSRGIGTPRCCCTVVHNVFVLLKK